MDERVAAVSAKRQGVIWVQEMLPREEVIQFYTHAAVFCCPSVYEPFGIINLEAMACETAVVASAVGGIPEVVVPGETGLLVEPRAQAAAPSSRPTRPRSRRRSPPRSTASPSTPSSGSASAATAAAARSSSSAGTPSPRGPSISTARCYRALSPNATRAWPDPGRVVLAPKLVMHHHLS